MSLPWIPKDQIGFHLAKGCLPKAFLSQYKIDIVVYELKHPELEGFAAYEWREPVDADFSQKSLCHSEEW